MAKKLGFWVVAVSASAPPQDAGELPPGGGGRNPRYWLMRCTKKGFGFTKISPWFLGWEFFTPQFLFRKKNTWLLLSFDRSKLGSFPLRCGTSTRCPEKDEQKMARLVDVVWVSFVDVSFLLFCKVHVNLAFSWEFIYPSLENGGNPPVFECLCKST